MKIILIRGSARSIEEGRLSESDVKTAGGERFKDHF
jgi:hypothetical protein